MIRTFLSIRGIFLVGAILAALAAGGCGGGDSTASGSEDGGEITVESGSLSKPEFVVQADAICTKSNAKFTREYETFYRNNEPPPSLEAQKVWLGEAVDEILIPSYEEEIEQISSLGAPAAEVDKVASFLNALQRRLGVFQQNPVELTKTATPFKEAAGLAAKADLTGCAEILG